MKRIKAVVVGKTEIDKDELEVRMLHRDAQRIRYVLRAEYGHVIAQALQHVLERLQDERMIVDDKHLHGVSPLGRTATANDRPNGSPPQAFRLSRRGQRGQLPCWPIFSRCVARCPKSSVVTVAADGRDPMAT